MDKNVVFRNNPIKEMIIQVSFPTIFILEEQPPSAFQKEIFNLFPFAQMSYDRQQNIFLSNDINVKSTITEKDPKKNYCFISNDGERKINLTSNFISFSTLKYDKWENVFKTFIEVFNRFVDIYKPISSVRIGVRYVNSFSKEKLGLERYGWNDLISDRWTQLFKTIGEDNIKDLGTDIVFNLDKENSIAKIHAGLGLYSGETEISFILDCDFIKNDITEIPEIGEALQYLHDSEHNFLFDAIKEPLYSAMEPIKK